ncbi:MAG: hypothetical protein RBR29_02345 [Castellaniella sp.]|uniref:hypothetical protein n=1 Tax=Castellaniella sp. TaxID=1955812 RepID=UPI002A370F07|nr:hypothetical protein [Castellaniella sp.]MDY0308621.1 hypothetical protein [Castellaniella sp.]
MTMPRALFLSISRLLSLALLALLAACAQQREPGFYDIPRGDTTSDARHRAQGDASTVAPTQLQFGFGADNQKSPTPGNGTPTNAASTGGPATQQVSGATLPRELAETRTYLGTIACPAGQQACPARRMTLTLAPDGQWRARSTPLDDSTPTVSMGCWHLVSTEPAGIVLQTGDHARATLEFIQSNVLRLTRLDGQVPLLESRLTRQADIDPIDELAAHPAEACAAR